MLYDVLDPLVGQVARALNYGSLVLVVPLFIGDLI
jgi:hypothetical protein